MKLIKILVATTAVMSALSAQAETRLIEGNGNAKNREGILAHFELRVAQTNDGPAAGKFLMRWKRADAEILVTCDHPRYVAVRDREGRFEGPAKVVVRKNDGVRSWEGNVFFTGWDLNPASAHPDRVRMRFIRNPFEAPEGDFFYEGEVVLGNLVVKKS